MLKIFLNVILLAGLTACADPYISTSEANPEGNDRIAETATLPYSDKIERGELANGMKYFIAPNAKPEKRVYIRLVVNAGSLNEDDDQRARRPRRLRWLPSLRAA